MVSVALRTIDLPDFGMPTVEPSIPPETYEKRIKALQGFHWWVWPQGVEPAAATLVIYADSEHMANLAYLTGYDPRFEEALLILVKTRMPESDWMWIPRPPTLVVGNEGWGYTAISPLKLEKALYQNFSLLGQPRNDSM